MLFLVGNHLVAAAAIRLVRGRHILQLHHLVESVEVASGPPAVPHGEKGPELDEGVEPGEQEVCRDENDILRVTPEVGKRLHHLEKDHAEHEGDKGKAAVRLCVHESRAMKSVEQGDVVEEGKVCKRRKVDGVDAPRLRPPDMSVSEAGGVGAPGGSHPAPESTDKLGAAAERRGDERLGAVLDADLPAVGDAPAREEVVVVDAERADEAEEAVVVGVFFGKIRVHNHLGTHKRGPARDDKDTAVHGVGRADLEVVTLQVEALDHVEDAVCQRAVAVLPDDALVGADQADAVVVEGGQGKVEEPVRPEDVVVHEGYDVRGDLGQCVGHLLPLVGLFRSNDVDRDVKPLS